MKLINEAISTQGSVRSLFLNKRSLTIIALIFSFVLVYIFGNIRSLEHSEEYYKDLLVTVDVQSSYDGRFDAPIELGAFDLYGNRVSFKAAFSFVASEDVGFQNLFQTSDGNRGIRLELSGSVLSLLVRSANYSAPNMIVLSENVIPGIRHTVEILAIQERYIRVAFDGKPAVVPNLFNFSIDEVKLGSGFDESRKFLGNIEDFQFATAPLAPFEIAFLFVDKHFWIIFGALATALLVSCQQQVAKDMLAAQDVKDAAEFKPRMLNGKSQIEGFLFLISLLLICAGVLYSVSSNYFFAQAVQLRSDLLDGFFFKSETRPFKSELLIFVLMQLVVIGAMGLTWVASAAVKTPWFGRVSRRIITIALMTFALIAAASTDDIIAQVMFFLAIPIAVIPLVTGAFLLILPINLIASICVLFHFFLLFPVRFISSFCDRLRVSPFTDFIMRVLFSRALKLACLFGFIGALSYPIFSQWYPVYIPDDYMELKDSVSLKTAEGQADFDRSELIACLTLIEAAEIRFATFNASAGQSSSRCELMMTLPYNDRAELKHAMAATGTWQGEPGRLLFHHSYLFVPAKHFLTYGLDAGMPYLYGFGQTIFHAGLMLLVGGPSLSNYFVTFPIAEYLGVISIAALVLGITRNATVATAALMLSLAAFYMINYFAVFLAASFSPLRLFGLVIQIASMAFFSSRTSRLRFVVLPLAAAFSLFWNREFGQIGAVGQALIIFAPQLAISFKYRIALISTLVLTVGIASFYPATSQDIVSTVGLSFFNFSMPSIAARDFGLFMLKVCAMQIALLALSMLFFGEARAFRLALVPVLALLLAKYVLNPSPPHYYVMCTLLWPILLIYLPWGRNLGSNLAYFSLPPLYAVLMFLGAVTYAARYAPLYENDSREFRSVFIKPFTKAPWTSLNETVSFVAPQQPIESRVTAIQSRIRPGDKVLLLSPFDHLLSFYVAPQSYCGHFDLMTNFVTKTVKGEILSCVNDAEHLLVVYDTALEVPCPTDALQMHPVCQSRASMKANLSRLRDEIAPMLELVGADGDLVFYRHDKPFDPAK